MTNKTVTLINIEKNPVGPIDIIYMPKGKLVTLQVFKGTPLRKIPASVLESSDAEKAINKKRMTFVDDTKVEEEPEEEKTEQVQNETPTPTPPKPKGNKGKDRKNK